MVFRLSFHGGAGTVTGSRHLLDAGGKRVLVDAGLFQGLKELRLLNWQKPAFEPAALDAVLLTHGHIDHSSYLPRLVRDGLRAPIFCTPGTRDLAEILLLDSAKLQEEDAAYANRQGYSKHRPALPLCTAADADAALALMRAVPYGDWIDLGRSLRGRFVNAGHILGSAIVEVEARVGGRTATLVFSGDVGRYDAPLHPDPSPAPACDVLVMESTYGDRVHDATPFAEQIREPMRRILARGGVVLVPSFAVGRAQLVTLLLRRAMETGDLPEVPIHIDSPMAVDATEVYARHADEENLDPDVVGSRSGTRRSGRIYTLTARRGTSYSSFQGGIQVVNDVERHPGPVRTDSAASDTERSVKNCSLNFLSTTPRTTGPDTPRTAPPPLHLAP